MGEMFQGKVRAGVIDKLGEGQPPVPPHPLKVPTLGGGGDT